MRYSYTAPFRVRIVARQQPRGPEGDRTPDLIAASDALSQLSYKPVTYRNLQELLEPTKAFYL